MAKTVKCPKCGNDSEFSPANLYRPFCSQRCQLIDLGQWADEKYSVPTTESGSPQDDEPEIRKDDQDDDGAI